MQQVRKLVSKKELKSIYGIPYSFAHIARLEAAGQFPKRLRLGACRVAWYADEIEEWIDALPGSPLLTPYRASGGTPLRR